MINSIKGLFKKAYNTIKHMSNKLIDFMTPKNDYSKFTPEDAESLRKLDRVEAKERIENFCFWMVYVVICTLSIVRAVKKSKELCENISE